MIKHLVVSTHLKGEDIATVLDSGYFEGVTLGYNVLNFPFRTKGVEAAAKCNVGLVTMNPLCGGMIPRNPDRLAFLKGPEDKNVVQAALRFNVSHPAITAALVGFASKAEVDQAVAAIENFKPHSAEHIEKVKSHLTASFEGLCTGCGYCLPCALDVEIPKLMDAYNMKILDGSDDAIKERLKWHWSLAPDAAAACIQCGDCEDRCHSTSADPRADGSDCIVGRQVRYPTCRRLNPRWLSLNDLDSAVQGLPRDHEHTGMADEERQPLQDLLWRPPLEKGKEVFVGLLHALFQLPGRHFGRHEHRVGPAVFFTFMGQKASLALQLIVDWRTGVGRQDVEQGVFNPHLLDVGFRGLEDALILVVKAEDEESLHQDAVVVKTPHDLLIVLNFVLHHAGTLQ